MRFNAPQTPGINSVIDNLTAGELDIVQDLGAIVLAQGDIFYYNGTNTVKLPAGTNGQLLTTGGAAANPSWTTISASGDMVLASIQTVTGAKTFNDAKLILAGLTSGTTVLKSGAIAGTSVITLPVATDTLVGKATTDVFTNKSIDADTNTITNIENADIKAAAAIAVNKLAALTASQITGTDASGFLVSLAVATYPSLTELTYVKGVTSAIQTQLTAKAPIASPTFTGTVYAPLLGVGSANAGNAYIEAKTLTVGSVQGFRVEADTATNIQFSSFITADAQLRFSFLADGTMKWGSGAAVADTNLYRSAADTLKTDDSLIIVGSLGATATRVLKGWFADIESTNMPTVGGTAILTSLTAPQFTTIELGNASDTTLSRSAAGTLAVEGIRVRTTTPLVVSAASYTTDTGVSLNMDNLDQFVITAQAGALLFNAPGGTLVQGRSLVIRIKDNATARALTWNAVFRAMGTALPSTTVLSKTLYLGFYYNATDVKWDLVASAQEA